VYLSANNSCNKDNAGSALLETSTTGFSSSPEVGAGALCFTCLRTEQTEFSEEELEELSEDELEDGERRFLCAFRL
jgi:hypothetical protein